MNKSIALEAFEGLAEDYLNFVDEKPHNAYYERPAMIQFVNEIELIGKIALDAGCSAGWYSKQLLDRGAKVIGIDISPAMIECAKKRTNGEIEAYVANLENPLVFMKSRQVDLIISSLTLHYIKDWSIPLREFYRILKPGGEVVLSVQHPMSDFKVSKTGVYYGTELVEYIWKGMPSGPVNVPYYRRSFATMINDFIQAGFIIKKVVEPEPVEMLKGINQAVYQKLLKEPAFICFHLTK